MKVLDDNSSVPFSTKAKEGLISGSSVIVPGPAWLGPPEKCRRLPAKRTVYEELSKLSKEAEGLDQRQLLPRMQDFVDVVVEQEPAALESAARLECLQRWVAAEERRWTSNIESESVRRLDFSEDCSTELRRVRCPEIKSWKPA